MIRAGRLARLGPMVLVLACVGACDRAPSEPRADRSTPEGAILALQQSLTAGDLEAALACRDFEGAARLMLERRLEPNAIDAEMLAANAELLRTAFEQELQRKGFPDYSHTISKFTGREPFRGREDLVIVDVELTASDHSRTAHRYLVKRHPSGWRVLGPAD